MVRHLEPLNQLLCFQLAILLETNYLIPREGREGAIRMD